MSKRRRSIDDAPRSSHDELHLTDTPCGDVAVPGLTLSPQPLAFRDQYEMLGAQQRTVNVEAFSSGGRSRSSCIHHAAVSRRACVRVVAFQRNAKRLKYSPLGQPRNQREPLIITVQPDGSDAWRLEPAAQLLKAGGVRQQGLRSSADPPQCRRHATLALSLLSCATN